MQGLLFMVSLEVHIFGVNMAQSKAIYCIYGERIMTFIINIWNSENPYDTGTDGYIIWLRQYDQNKIIDIDFIHIA